MNQNEHKKGGFLWNVLIVALLLVLIVLVGVSIFKKNPDAGEDSQKPNTQTQSETDTDSEGVSSEDEGQSNTETESETESQIVVEPPVEDDGSETFVMFGVDSRSDKLGKGTRSDSIMIINVNHDKGEVKVVSIYRDCMVYQEGKGYKKITNAHSYFGPEGALEVINENFDLNIEKYTTVNFNAVGDLIDMVGGVEQDITEAEVKYINGYIDETNGVRGTSSAHITEPGTYLLDGTQAVAYSRIRYTAGSDYKRTERQRTILFKVFEKSKTLSVTDRLSLAQKMLKEINTNYKEDEMLSLIYYISKYDIVTMTAYPQVFYGGSVDGSWVEVPCTLIDMNAGLHEALFGTTDYKPSARVEEISQTLRNKVTKPNIDMRD